MDEASRGRPVRAAVVFESVFGQTRQVAEAVARGLTASGADVRLGTTEEVSPDDLDGVDLLVVGGPTHLRGMSTGVSRTLAPFASEHPPTRSSCSRPRIGLRSWLRALDPGRGRPAAAFATALVDPRAGSAAAGIARRLARHGWECVIAPASFHVFGVNRGLRGYEAIRAETWGSELAAVATAEPASEAQSKP